MKIPISISIQLFGRIGRKYICEFYINDIDIDIDIDIKNVKSVQFSKLQRINNKRH